MNDWATLAKRHGWIEPEVHGAISKRVLAAENRLSGLERALRDLTREVDDSTRELGVDTSERLATAQRRALEVLG